MAALPSIAAPAIQLVMSFIVLYARRGGRGGAAAKHGCAVKLTLLRPFGRAAGAAAPVASNRRTARRLLYEGRNR